MKVDPRRGIDGVDGRTLCDGLCISPFLTPALQCWVDSWKSSGRSLLVLKRRTASLGLGTIVRVHNAAAQSSHRLACYPALGKWVSWRTRLQVEDCFLLVSRALIKATHWPDPGLEAVATPTSATSWQQPSAWDTFCETCPLPAPIHHHPLYGRPEKPGQLGWACSSLSDDS